MANASAGRRVRNLVGSRPPDTRAATLQLQALDVCGEDAGMLRFGRLLRHLYTSYGGRNWLQLRLVTLPRPIDSSNQSAMKSRRHRHPYGYPYRMRRSNLLVLYSASPPVIPPGGYGTFLRSYHGSTSPLANLVVQVRYVQACIRQHSPE